MSQVITQLIDHFPFYVDLMPCLSPCSVQGWQATSKPAFEIHSLERSVKGNSVPMPKSVIRLILNSVLPRLLQRKLLRLLPQELGEYLLQAGKGFGLGGELYAWCVPCACAAPLSFCSCVHREQRQQGAAVSTAAGYSDTTARHKPKPQHVLQSGAATFCMSDPGIFAWQSGSQPQSTGASWQAHVRSLNDALGGRTMSALGAVNKRQPLSCSVAHRHMCAGGVLPPC